MHLTGFTVPCAAGENTPLLFKNEIGFMSQPSIFIGTHTSKRIWLSIPWGLMVEMLKSCLLCSSINEPTSLVSPNSIEFGDKKWSLGLLEAIAVLLRLSAERTPGMLELDAETGICLQEARRSWCAVENLRDALASNSVTAAVYSALWRL